MVLLASDKHATAQHLADVGVPVPHGVPHVLGEPWPDDFRYPAVWKPLDGAGSVGLRLVEQPKAPLPQAQPQAGRLEELCPAIATLSSFAPRKGVFSRSDRRQFTTAGPVMKLGSPASVAFLCGPGAIVELPPCRQHLAEDFCYLGGSLPLEPHLAGRAGQLARRAIEALPRPLGYVGVDLVLSAADAAGDAVIEINPRLTTSYLGLRAACRENLAEAMLAVAVGKRVNLSFHNNTIAWEVNGRMKTSAENGERNA
jgi:predicted ATP-grasp superfamily ATP-dependent carboligase